MSAAFLSLAGHQWPLAVVFAIFVFVLSPLSTFNLWSLRRRVSVNEKRSDESISGNSSDLEE
jgi:hypothetical protein